MKKVKDMDLSEEDKLELKHIKDALADPEFAASIKRRAFAVNGSITYMKGGKLVREYKNGRIEIVSDKS